MYKFILTILSVVLLFGCLQQEHGEKTTVKVFQKEVDLGNISVTKPLELAFVLKNTGQNTLIIDSVMPSCECVSATFNSAKTPPSQYAVIILTYHPENLTGEIFRTADVVCNSSAPLEFSFTANLINHKK